MFGQTPFWSLDIAVAVKVGLLLLSLSAVVLVRLTFKSVDSE